MEWLIVLYVFIAVVVLFLAVILVRAIMFKPLPTPDGNVIDVDFDKEKAISNLQTLVRFKTVSNVDSSLEDESEFKGFVDKLPELYPEVFKTCELKKFDGRALLFKWVGKSKRKVWYA